MSQSIIFQNPFKNINLIEVFPSVSSVSKVLLFPVKIDGSLHTVRVTGNALWIAGKLADTMHSEMVSFIGNAIETNFLNIIG